MVNLGADILAALPALRAQAESMMTDTWKCVRSQPGSFDDVSGVWTPATDATVYDGPGRLRDVDNIGRRDDSQGETTVIGRLRLALPIATSGALRVDDVLTCTTSATDPALVGVQVRVSDLHVQTQSTSRRLSVEIESWPTTT